MRILIADDDRVTRLSLEAQLSQWGYEVISCADGKEAWKVLQSKDAPALAVLDWVMPELTGVEICRRIRAQENNASTYLILFTSRDQQGDQVEGLEAGADDYLSKPLDLVQLQARIRVGERILDQQRQLEEKQRLMTAYHRIGRATLASQNLNEVLDNLTGEILNAAIFRSIMVALVEESSQTVEVVRNYVRTRSIRGGAMTPVPDVAEDGSARRLFTNHEIIGKTYPLDDENITCVTARTGKLQIVEEWDQRLDSQVSTRRERQGQVAYFIPIKTDKRVLAVLATGSQMEDKEETLRRIEAMQPLLDQAAVALEHVRTVEGHKRKLAMERLQRAIAEMEQEDDFDKVVQVLAEELVQLGIAFEAISLKVIDEPGEQLSITFINAQYELTRDIEPLTRPANQDLVAYWQRGEVWERTVDGLIRDINKAYAENSAVVGDPDVIIDVPFEQGTLGIELKNSSGGNAAAIEILQEFCVLISLGFKRFGDIVERRRAEQERAESRQELAHLQFLYQLRADLENSRSPLEVIQRVGKTLVTAIAAFPPAGVRLYYHGQEWTFGETDDPDQHVYEQVLRWGEQEHGWLRLYCGAVLDEVQQQALLYAPMALLGQGLEARELELQLLQSSRLVSLGQMAAGVAHELNQPLAAISATAEGIVLRQEQGIEVEAARLKEMMEHITAMVERMGEIIQHLRVFSRDTSQEQGSLFAINEVVDSSLKMIRTQLNSHGIALQLELEESRTVVRGHPHQVEQVLLNLLANARDALDECGEGVERRILIRTRREPEDGGWIVLEVEDNGAGMDAETRTRLFEPFFTTKDADKGTGLGMSISYAIVQNHHGRIGCQSQVGAGTTFEVALPEEREE